MRLFAATVFRLSRCQFEALVLRRPNVRALALFAVVKVQGVLELPLARSERKWRRVSDPSGLQRAPVSSMRSLARCRATSARNDARRRSASRWPMPWRSRSVPCSCASSRRTCRSTPALFAEGFGRGSAAAHPSGHVADFPFESGMCALQHQNFGFLRAIRVKTVGGFPQAFKDTHEILNDYHVRFGGAR